MSLAIDGVWKAGAWATTVWADGVWAEGATQELIGRKRRGRARPRKQTVVEALQDIREEKDYLAEVLAEAQTELKLTQLTAHNTVNHNRNIDRISRKVTELETQVARLREEEEVLLMLSFVALEM